MTIDERIEKLVGRQEEFESNQQKLQQSIIEVKASQAKTEEILVSILDGLTRLERIALAHEVRLQDVESTLAKLETRRPQ
jgi:DNA-binding TFAR19-related protein (PDSD5 family)